MPDIPVYRSRFEKRATIIILIFITMILALTAKLLHIQFLNNRLFAEKSLNQHMESINLRIGRGAILDRNLRPLTDISEQYSLYVFPKLLTPDSGLPEKLSTILGMPEYELERALKAGSKPAKLAEDLTMPMIREIEALGNPGLIVAKEALRYRYPPLAAHTIGYTTKSGASAVSGIESQYDRILRQSGGSPRAALLLDGMGRPLAGLGVRKVDTSPEPLNGIVLTIDREIQSMVEEVMDESMTKGAVVVMDPHTGDILAIASRPHFDPNNPSEYLNSPGSPFLNRAVSAYEPGSVFKIVIAAAALEEGYAYAGERFYDPGYIYVGSLRFRCYSFEDGGHGIIDLKEAMAKSCNTAFIALGLRLGAYKIREYAERFGFGRSTGSGVAGEVQGNLSPLRYVSEGDIANMSIGQKDILVTPLQVAKMASIIANGGFDVTPRIVKEVLAPSGNGTASGNIADTGNISEGQKGERLLRSETVEEIRNMLRLAVTEGTGTLAEVGGIGAAGKTGSAETGRTTPDMRSINHAWFAGYIPYDSPEYVIVVFVEDGYSGGAVAAPIFRSIASRLEIGG